MPLRSLIVDDDAVCRTTLVSALRGFGEADAAATGRDAVEAVRKALAEGRPYHLITLDIMMPDLDGQAALAAIRGLEATADVARRDAARIFMTTALGDGRNVMKAFRGDCTGYLTKPVDLDRLFAQLREQGLME